MAQEIRRRGGATKIDVFNKQVSGDDGIFACSAPKHRGIVADARYKRRGNGATG